jgi:hypothetical protein
VLLVDGQALAREAIVARFDHEPGFTVVQGGSLTEARRLHDSVEIGEVAQALRRGAAAMLNKLDDLDPTLSSR